MGGINWQEEWPEHYIPYDDLRPDDPSGLRVVNYNKEGDYNIHNIKAEGGVIMLYEGLNDLLFYNNDTEYIIFSRTGNGVTTRYAHCSKLFSRVGLLPIIVFYAMCLIIRNI